MLAAATSIERPFKAAKILPVAGLPMSAIANVTSHSTVRKARVANGSSMVMFTV